MDEVAVLRLWVTESQGGIAFVIRGNPQPFFDSSIPIGGVNQESVETASQTQGMSHERTVV